MDLISNSNVIYKEHKTTVPPV